MRWLGVAVEPRPSAPTSPHGLEARGGARGGATVLTRLAATLAVLAVVAQARVIKSHVHGSGVCGPTDSTCLSLSRRAASPRNVDE